MMHIWPELLHKSRSPGPWCQISGRLSYLGCENIVMCVDRTVLPLPLSTSIVIGQLSGISCTCGLPHTVYMSPLGRKHTLAGEDVYDGNCLSCLSERITIWVRVKGELVQAIAAPIARHAVEYLAHLWRTATANPRKKRMYHVICR